MLVDAQNYFITARNHPRLALVETRLEEGSLLINGPGMPELRLPPQPAQAIQIEVQVWRDRCTAVLAGENSDHWFSSYLGIPVRLVQMTDDMSRPVDPAYGRLGDEVSFADGFPLLLISEASLEDLNTRLKSPVSMRRFRPNIVVSGCDAFDEDHWRRIRVGVVEFVGVKACSRCVFTTIDPDTGIKDPNLEPLRTLGSYRRRVEGGVFFGQNLIPDNRGTIQVGDPVEVLETG
jgi:uncharacterized protein YcbX